MSVTILFLFPQIWVPFYGPTRWVSPTGLKAFWVNWAPVPSLTLHPLYLRHFLTGCSNSTPLLLCTLAWKVWLAWAWELGPTFCPDLLWVYPTLSQSHLIFSVLINLGLAELANGFLLLADFWQHTAAYCLSLQSHESLRNVQDQLTTNTVLNSKPPSPLTQSWQRCNI